MPEARTVHIMNKFKAGNPIICPRCGHWGSAVPHTRKGNAYALICTGRMEKETLYFTVVTAIYWFEKESFDHLDALKGGIFVDEIGEIGRERQQCYLEYGDYFSMTSNPFIHHDITECAPYMHPSFAASVQRSCLRYAGIRITTGRNYDLNTTIKALALNAKYPQLEYLKKAGLGEIETAMIYGRSTYLRPNWKRADLPGLLGLTSQDLDKLRCWGMWDVDHIAAYKVIKRHHKRTTKKDMDTFFKFFSDIGPFTASYQYQESFKGLDPVRTAAYLERIYEENMPCCGHGVYGWYDRGRIGREYSDYLRQLKTLEYPQTGYYLYPKDFITAHDRLSAEYRQREDQIKQKEKKVLQERYEKEFLPKLKKLSWSDGKYFIRPLESYAEFSAEGKNNVNCVASYYDMVTKGKTAVFVIRRKDNPDESLVTVEMMGGRLAQCRAKGNRQPDDEVLAFAKRWMEEIVNRKKKKEAA